MRIYLFIISSVIFLLWCSNISYPGTNDEFEGIVVYKVEVFPKNPAFEDPGFLDYYGSELRYYYKAGNYKMIYNGKLGPTIYYKSQDNIQFTIMPTSDTVFITDCSTKDHDLLESKIESTKEKILGLNCKVLKNVTKNGPQYTYYYNSKLTVSSKYFKNHKLFHVDEYYNKTNSLILKYKYEGFNFDLVQTATKIIPGRLKNREFDIPEGPRKRF